MFVFYKIFSVAVPEIGRIVLIVICSIPTAYIFMFILATNHIFGASDVVFHVSDFVYFYFDN